MYCDVWGMMSRQAGIALICAGALACTSAGMFLGVVVGGGHVSQILSPAPALGKAKPGTAHPASRVTTRDVTVVHTDTRTVSQPAKTVTSTLTTPPVTVTTPPQTVTVTITQPQSTSTTTP